MRSHSEVLSTLPRSRRRPAPSYLLCLGVSQREAASVGPWATLSATGLSCMLRASANRAPDDRRSEERTRPLLYAASVGKSRARRSEERRADTPASGASKSNTVVREE